jgi:ethanolamine utilization protein EutN
MQIGRVVGHATATVKHPSLQGWKLMLVQLLTRDGKPEGEPILAIDDRGAATGSEVIVCNDGATAREMTNDRKSPARWFVMGIVD